MTEEVTMFGQGKRIDQLEARLQRQERLIEELCRVVGMDPSRVVTGPTRVAADPAPVAATSGTGVDAEERRLIAAGKKIAAIKHYRERTGAGLREAKNAIDAADRR